MPEIADQDLCREWVTFYQHHLPGLEDGTYQLSVSQRIEDAAGASITPADDTSLANTYTFAVLGDRFRFKNPGDVLFGLFPADRDTGEFSNVLPHVVFSKPTFPWTRSPTTTSPRTGLTPGSPADADQASWLAVLLLDEDDLGTFAPLAPGVPSTVPAVVGPKSATIGDLFPRSVNASSSLPGDAYSCFHAAQDMTGLEVGETLTDPIQVIDLPLALFWQIAPSLEDLQLLSHVREVSLRNKPSGTGAHLLTARQRRPSPAAVGGPPQEPDPSEPLGAFSIVVGNRFAQPGKSAYAFLVSLERLAEFLPDGDGNPKEHAQGTGIIRLAVLTSWSFNAEMGNPAAFVARVKGLNDGGKSADTLTLSYAGADAGVRSALAMGYAPLTHALRTADENGHVEETVSWYRGPLVPYEIPKARVSLPLGSADEGLILDPITGMLDASYAAAWTLGRMLALQDKAFSVALYVWKRGLAQKVVQSAENQVLEHAFADLLASMPRPMALARRPEPPAAALLAHDLLRALRPRR